MKVCVERVLDKNIYFSTEYGKGKGVWKGDERPTMAEYYVELDVDRLYRYDDFIISKNEEFQMNISNEENQLTLLLLEYDELGCATFRLGDSIVEIETIFDERFFALKNLYLKFSVEELYLYDENI